MKKNVYPPMHTAEHILNQTMVRLFATERCFSAHIEQKKSKCDYIFNRELTNEEIENIENTVNNQIKKDLPITTKKISKIEADQKYKLKNILEATKEVQIVCIGDYDSVPCIGPHVSTTKELGTFKIVSSSYNNNVLRIRYKLLNNQYGNH